MFNSLVKLYEILNRKEKLLITFYTILIVLETLLELLTLSIIFPVLAYITSDQSYFDKNILNFIFDYLLSLSHVIVASLFVSFFLIKSLIIIFIRKIFLDFCIKVSRRISKDIFESTFKQKLYSFLNVDNSEHIRNLQIIPNHFQNVLMGIMLIYSEIIIIFFVIVFIFYYSSALSLFSFLPFIFSLLIYVVLSKKKLDIISQKAFSLPSDLIQIIKNSIDNFMEIKILNNSSDFLLRYLKKQVTFFKVTRNYTIIQLIPKYVIEISLIIFLIFSFFVISNFGTGKEELITFFSLIVISSYRLIPSINRIFSFLQNLKFYYPSINKIYTVNKENTQNKSYKKIKNINFKEVVISNLSFNYKNKEIINNLDFSITHGQKLLIFGKSGSGKSTFLKLLSGLLEQNSGKIEFFYSKKFSKNTPIYKMDNFFYIPQNSFLFDGTLYQNITLNFSEKVSRIAYKKLLKIIDDFNLTDDFNNFSEGLNTKVYSNSSNISGGQKQLISILRALFLEPKFLILDESLNSLNEEIHIKILSKLLSMKKLTLILVSHNSDLKKSFSNIYEFKGKTLKKIND